MIVTGSTLSWCNMTDDLWFQCPSLTVRYLYDKSNSVMQGFPTKNPLSRQEAATEGYLMILEQILLDIVTMLGTENISHFKYDNLFGSSYIGPGFLLFTWASSISTIIRWPLIMPPRRRRFPGCLSHQPQMSSRIFQDRYKILHRTQVKSLSIYVTSSVKRHISGVKSCQTSL